MGKLVIFFFISFSTWGNNQQINPALHLAATTNKQVQDCFDKAIPCFEHCRLKAFKEAEENQTCRIDDKGIPHNCKSFRELILGRNPQKKIACNQNCIKQRKTCLEK